MSQNEFKKYWDAFHKQIPFEQSSKMVQEADKYLEKCGSATQARTAFEIAIAIKEKTLKLE